VVDNSVAGKEEMLMEGCVAMEVETYAGLQLRVNTMVEPERLEDNGISDELMKMQEMLWPIE
jgi:hypothetical protein